MTNPATNVLYTSDISEKIFLFTSISDLKSCSQVCQSWRQVIDGNERLWKKVHRHTHFIKHPWIGPQPHMWHTYAIRVHMYIQSYWIKKNNKLNPANFVTLGTRLYNKRYVNESLALFAQAQYFESDPIANTARSTSAALIHLRLGHLTSSHQLLNSLTETEKTLRIRGDIYLEQQLYNQAQNCYLQSVQKTPTDPNALLGLLQIYKLFNMKSHYSEIKERILRDYSNREIEKGEYENYHLTNSLILAKFYLIHSPEDSLYYCHKVPSDLAAYFRGKIHEHRFRMFFRKGPKRYFEELAQAKKCYSESIRKNPYNSKVLFDLIHLLFYEIQTRAALDKQELLIQNLWYPLHDNTTESAFATFCNFSREDRIIIYREIDQELDKLLLLLPESAEAYFLKGRIAFLLENWEKALKAFLLAEKQGLQEESLITWKMKIYLKLSYFQQADLISQNYCSELETCEQKISILRQLFQSDCCLSYIENYKWLEVKEIVSYLVTIARKYSLENALNFTFELCNLIKNYSITKIRTFLENNPNSIFTPSRDFMFYRSQILIDFGTQKEALRTSKWGEAQQHLEMLLKTHPKDIVYLMTYGKLLEMQANYSKAETVFQQALFLHMLAINQRFPKMFLGLSHSIFPSTRDQSFNQSLQGRETQELITHYHYLLVSGMLRCLVQQNKLKESIELALEAATYYWEILNPGLAITLFEGIPFLYHRLEGLYAFFLLCWGSHLAQNKENIIEGFLNEAYHRIDLFPLYMLIAENYKHNNNKEKRREYALKALQCKPNSLCAQQMVDDQFESNDCPFSLKKRGNLYAKEGLRESAFIFWQFAIKHSQFPQDMKVLDDLEKLFNAINHPVDLITLQRKSIQASLNNSVYSIYRA